MTNRNKENSQPQHHHAPHVDLELIRPRSVTEVSVHLQSLSLLLSEEILLYIRVELTRGGGVNKALPIHTIFIQQHHGEIGCRDMQCLSVTYKKKKIERVSFRLKECIHSTEHQHSFSIESLLMQNLAKLSCPKLLFGLYKNKTMSWKEIRLANMSLLEHEVSMHPILFETGYSMTKHIRILIVSTGNWLDSVNCIAIICQNVICMEILHRPGTGLAEDGRKEYQALRAHTHCLWCSKYWKRNINIEVGVYMNVSSEKLMAFSFPQSPYNPIKLNGVCKCSTALCTAVTKETLYWCCSISATYCRRDEKSWSVHP